MKPVVLDRLKTKRIGHYAPPRGFETASIECIQNTLVHLRTLRRHLDLRRTHEPSLPIVKKDRILPESSGVC